jgi:hypothetical protein
MGPATVTIMSSSVNLEACAIRSVGGAVCGGGGVCTCILCLVCVCVYTHTCSKVVSIVALCSKPARALTFENPEACAISSVEAVCVCVSV